MPYKGAHLIIKNPKGSPTFEKVIERLCEYFKHIKEKQLLLKMYFPQTNNGVFSFGRDVNIHFKHGVNALAVEEQDRKGRISII